MEYYIYYSHQKVMQLFRQLPESRYVGVKVGTSSNHHGDMDISPGEQEEKCLRVTHASKRCSNGSFRESVFDPNDMYQLRRVLRALERDGRLRSAACADKAQGDFIEFTGMFSPQEDMPAPKDGLWLAAPARGGCPAMRLLCCERGFCGENEACARQEVWSCGAPLCLHGVMLCMQCSSALLCGLPLFLAI